MSISAFFVWALSGATGLAVAGWILPRLWDWSADYVRTVFKAKRTVSRQLSPLLRAADELQGKILSFAKEDFREFSHLARPTAPTRRDVVNLCSTLYLFAQMWAFLELFRREGFYAEISRDRRGRAVLGFIASLESQRVRLVDRAWQRAMGEMLIVGARPNYDVLPFHEFVSRYEGDSTTRAWFEPLADLLKQSGKSKGRQRVLHYGVIVHALLDTLDAKHRATKNRPGYPNKLTRRTKHDLIGRTFAVYLPYVKDVAKYTGHVKSRRAWRWLSKGTGPAARKR